MPEREKRSELERESAFSDERRRFASEVREGREPINIRLALETGVESPTFVDRTKGRPSGEISERREQIESRLYGQQLSMIARRYMRDLRTSATIETR